MGLTRVFLRLTAVVFFATLLVPVVTAFCSRLNDQTPWTAASYVAYPTLALTAAACGLLFAGWLRARAQALDDHFAAQTTFLDELPARYVDLAIFGAAALSLFLELAIIRWQATVFEFFAFYKNFTLLSCFAGLGLGYALAGRDRMPLAPGAAAAGLAVPVPDRSHAACSSSGSSSLRRLPFPEQLSMGCAASDHVRPGRRDLLLPRGRLRADGARLRPDRAALRPADGAARQLRAYGMNLLGSLVGVVATFVVSCLWTPPIVWFAARLRGDPAASRCAGAELVVAAARRRSP